MRAGKFSLVGFRAPQKRTPTRGMTPGSRNRRSEMGDIHRAADYARGEGSNQFHLGADCPVWRRSLATAEPSEAAHSMTSSARARINGGMAKPSAVAVFRLTSSSKVAACCTGSSPGWAPFRTLST